ncbi:hypothetical protein SAMN05192558_101383 [Actinokineospora alba]|uniref:Subtilase family protein n=1 Tax=Actinokineospora alba TaxID=504798 RepID=A0A1H0FIF8_9PSEU|nr:hypothetical protein [Actinokineospora alba]TDP69491.1 hypothetical protein C8E96_5079 [Actinokineospora alba]SDI15564.1 hypothetical protein SAMN05421871_103487 [Actinokineospora alba]SDN94384.1 hypothetical protein SAMN05192558_101383 [Actinokineospora alba]
MIGTRRRVRSPLLDLVRLPPVRRHGAGSPDIAIGLVSGDNDITALACVLTGDALSVSPLCPILPRSCPDAGVTPGELSVILGELLDGPANVIAIGTGLLDGGVHERRVLAETLDRAAERGVLIFAAGGPHTDLTTHSWVLPVSSCAPSGRVSWFVDLEDEPRGLLAPGEDLPGPTGPASGNGVAATLVAGTAALLLSLHPLAGGHRVRSALSIGATNPRRSGPPLLDVTRAHEHLGLLNFAAG